MRYPWFLKQRDYWLTVLVVDKIAIPVMERLLPTTVKPIQVTAWIGILGGVAAVAFSTGALWLGALMFFLSFLADCVDGKLARALNLKSLRGKVLDWSLDTLVRMMVVVGLMAHYGIQGRWDVVLWLGLYAAISATFIDILFHRMRTFGELEIPSRFQIDKWENFTARHRLTATPGFQDIQLVMYVVLTPLGLLDDALPWISMGLILCIVLMLIDILTRED